MMSRTYRLDEESEMYPAPSSTNDSKPPAVAHANDAYKNLCCLSTLQQKQKDRNNLRA